MAENYVSKLNGAFVKDKEAREALKVINVRDIQVKKSNGKTTVTVTDKDGKSTSVTINDGAVGLPGTSSTWYTGTAINGTRPTGTVYPNSEVENANVGDMYLNTSLYGVYICTKGGEPSVAEWSFRCNIKGGTGPQGPKGDNGITPLFDVFDGDELYVSYDNGNSWSYLAILPTGNTGGLELDTTLTQAGKAAEAKSVGERFTTLEETIARLNEEIENLKKQIPDGGDSYQTFELSIADNDWCGPYEVTYKASENGSIVDKTSVVPAGDVITITVILGTVLHISTDNSASYSGSTLHDENDTRVGSFDWNETEIQLPSSGTRYYLYLYG